MLLAVAFQSHSLVIHKESSWIQYTRVRKNCLPKLSTKTNGNRILPCWPHRKYAKSTLHMSFTSEKLDHWLWERNVDKKLSKCVSAVFDACKEIAYKIRTASCNKIACFNDFGDEQLAIDVLADKVIFENLENSGVVGVASSEEVPREQKLKGNGFAVAFDPLDGSSIIDTNFAVGSIFGIWPGDRLVGVKGMSQHSNYRYS
jgi:hypothetical protein